MIFNSALFVVLALVLSFTSANVQEGTAEKELMDKISSVVVHKLMQVANNATDNTSDAKMDTKLLNTIGDVLSNHMRPEVKELQYVSDDSPDQVAENLAVQISENVLSRDGKIASRSLANIFKKMGKRTAKSTLEAVLGQVKNSL